LTPSFGLASAARDLRNSVVDAVKAYALEHYNDGGWDVIVECWEDTDILECIGDARTVEDALARVSVLVDVFADRQADARHST